MSKNGLMIVFEGLDGTGKATQVNLLQQFFAQQNLDENIMTQTVIYDFPRYYGNFWGKTVGRMLNREFGSDINPYLRTPFYLLDQAEACKTMREDLANGKIVICNRYMTSSMIFQTALLRSPKAKSEYVQWLEEASYIHLQMLRPDVVFCLYVEPKIAQTLISKKNSRGYIKGKKKDMNEENLKHQKNAGKDMLHFCKTRKNWLLINCMDGLNIKSPKAINQMIVEKIKRYIKYIK